MTELSEKLRIIIEQQKETPVEKTPSEQQKEKMEDSKEDVPVEEPSLDGESAPPEESEENMGEDGMPSEELSSAENGKLFELRRIYYRLISIRNHLEIFVEEEFDEIKKQLTKAIEMFEVVIDNYNGYTERIDEIIIRYYQFLRDIYDLISKKYKKYSNKK